VTTNLTPSGLTLQIILGEQLLAPVYQPIVNLAEHTIYGHESLIRGPKGSPCHMPDVLFAMARAEDRLNELEFAAANVGIAQYKQAGGRAKLFINLSATFLVQHYVRHGEGHLQALFDQADMPLGDIVIELTEHDQVHHVEALPRMVEVLRAQGAQIALDDFGDGRSSLRLWSELRPDIVKIDRYFSRGIDKHAAKVQTFKAMLHLAETFGTRLVAEGIETREELEIIRDLGIGYAQGYLLGRPQAEATREIGSDAQEVLASTDIVVYPALRKVAQTHFSAEKLVISAPAINPKMRNDELIRIFHDRPELHALAVISPEGKPLGLINRRDFIDRYTHPYHKELFGKRACTAFMDPNPIVVDKHQSLEQLTEILVSGDQRYLNSGFVITEGGRYLGLGTGEQLVKAVTEVRIEAARHANPLTFLPGNIPISEHIARLLTARIEFTACYCDLNHFKPYNDQYGYWRGDEMIRLTAGVISANCDVRRDFVGHVGGDDFVVLFQSSDWDVRCGQIVSTFNERALGMFDEAALKAGGIAAEDRHGNPSFFPLTTLTIGAVRIVPDAFSRAEDVASAAALAKRHAKHGGGGLWLLDGGRTMPLPVPPHVPAIAAVGR
jgi:EAL domain-containing protein (putative c-di-GMP-specific phosphodiesterase class I)/GGDEF domain-containing protein